MRIWFKIYSDARLIANETIDNFDDDTIYVTYDENFLDLDYPVNEDKLDKLKELE